VLFPQAMPPVSPKMGKVEGIREQVKEKNAKVKRQKWNH